MQQKRLERVGEIIDHVPAVGDLDGLGRAARNAVGVQSTTIAGRHLDRRVRLKPRGDAVGRAIGQQVGRSMPLQITDNGAVAPPTFVGPVVAANDPGVPRIGRRRGADAPQERSGARAHAAVAGQTSTGLSASGEADLLQRLTEAVALASMRRDERGQTLGEDTARAGGGEAPETPHIGQDRDLPTTHGEVGHRPLIARMDAGRAVLAERATSVCAFDGNGHGDRVSV